MNECLGWFQNSVQLHLVNSVLEKKQLYFAYTYLQKTAHLATVGYLLEEKLLDYNQLAYWKKNISPELAHMLKYKTSIFKMKTVTLH